MCLATSRLSLIYFDSSCVFMRTINKTIEMNVTLERVDLVVASRSGLSTLSAVTERAFLSAIRAVQLSALYGHIDAYLLPRGHTQQVPGTFRASEGADVRNPPDAGLKPTLFRTYIIPNIV